MLQPVVGDHEAEEGGADGDEGGGGPGDLGGAEVGEDPVAYEGGGDAADSGEEGVDAHVGGFPAGGGDFCYPESPGNGAAAGSPAYEGCRKKEKGEGGAMKVEEEADQETEVDADANQGEVEVIEEVGPDGCAEDSGNGGNDDGDEEDDGVGGIDSVEGIGYVFDAEGDGDEVADAHEHPGKEHGSEELVFEGEFEVVP